MWSWALSFTGVMSLYLINWRYRSIFIVAATSNVALWTLYALATSQMGFLVSNAAYAAVYIWAGVKWESK